MLDNDLLIFNKAIDDQRKVENNTQFRWSKFVRVIWPTLIRQFEFINTPDVFYEVHRGMSLYDHSFDNGLQKARLNQLRELNWLDQIYNIILMGPSGTGKTFLAAGLCADAVTRGYSAYFRTMEELINMLEMKDFTRTATADYKRLLKANLIVIDDIMLFRLKKHTP